MQHSPLLLLVCIPMIGGILCLGLPDKLKAVTKLIALGITLFSLVMAMLVFIKKPIFWQALLTADNLSGFIAAAVAFFAFLITVFSLRFIEKSFGRYYGYLLMTLASALGVVFAGNLILLVVFWGILAALLYLFVNLQETDKAASAAKKALIIIGGTDAFLIFGIGLVWAMKGSVSMQGARIPLESPLSYAAYFCIAIAAFAKAGAVPFHSWLPEVAESGPTTVAAYLPASLDKLLGIYLLARASLSIFAMNSISNFVLALVGSVTIILAVVLALVQHDFKKLLGYHAVSQVGYMVLGIGTGNPIGIAGGLFHMLNNAIYKSCLFLTGGAVEKKTGTTDLEKLGGLSKYMPLTFVSCLIASLAISGIPPFNGFVSKWMIYQGIIESAGAKNPFWIAWLVAAMFGSALTIASFMKLLHTVFMGRPSKDYGSMKDVGLSMTIPMLILAGLCVIFGIFAFPIPLSRLIIPSIGKSISYLGLWTPVMATVLIIIGMLIGVFVYIFSRPKTFRYVEPFVGGEDAGKMGRIAGTEFYNTIEETKQLGFIYKKESAESFDIYEQARQLLLPFTRAIARAHNGILPTYMVWCLLGMIVMFVILLAR